MRLKKFLIQQKNLIINVLDIIQILNVFCNIKVITVIIIIIKSVIDRIEKGIDEVK